jgi:hypothetical protein
MFLTHTVRLLRWFCHVLLILGIPSPAPACTIPVFRYALERWELSSYEMIVFHRGPLAAEVRSALGSLPRQANLVVTPVDLDGKVGSAMYKLWEQHGDSGTLPCVVLRQAGTEDTDAKVRPAWVGPFDARKLRQLVDSPIRRQIVASVGNGSSGVFVVLLSGEQAADDAAVALVKSQLAKLEQLVKLPEQSGEGPRIRLALPLKVSFTVLPVKRDDPAEDGLVHLLLASEDSLSRVRGPIVFPVFGRGRVLGSLYDRDLDADNLFEVVSFLCAECSCQVKELNPGTDLLIAADWAEIFERIGPAPDIGPELPEGSRRFAARAKPLSIPLLIVPGASKAAIGEENSDGVQVQVAVSHYPPAPDLTMDSAVQGATPILQTTAEAPHRRWLWCATGAAALLVLITGAWACAQWRRGGSRGRT